MSFSIPTILVLKTKKKKKKKNNNNNNININKGLIVITNQIRPSGEIKRKENVVDY